MQSETITTKTAHTCHGVNVANSRAHPYITVSKWTAGARARKHARTHASTTYYSVSRPKCAGAHPLLTCTRTHTHAHTRTHICTHMRTYTSTYRGTSSSSTMARRSVRGRVRKRSFRVPFRSSTRTRAHFVPGSHEINGNIYIK